MSEIERNKYATEIMKKYCKERVLQSFIYHKKSDFDTYYEKALNLGCIGSKERLCKAFFIHQLLLRECFLSKIEFYDDFNST